MIYTFYNLIKEFNLFERKDIMSKNLFNEILGEVEEFSTGDNPQKIKKKMKKLSKKDRKKLENKLEKKLQKKIRKKLKKGSKKENKILLSEIHNLQQQLVYGNQRTDQIIMGFFGILNKQFQRPQEIVAYQDIPLLPRKDEQNER